MRPWRESSPARGEPNARRRAHWVRRGVALAGGLVLAVWSGLGGCPAQAAATPAGDPATMSIGVQVLSLTDTSRTIHVAHRRPHARTLETIVRYPRESPAPGPSPVKARPLIVFAHGFNVTPGAYDQLLDAWTRAGYVVAAPLFPLERRGAPGGSTRADLRNEPGDVSFVIGQLLSLSAGPGNRLSGRIARDHIAVAGHSDGGIVALSVGYDRFYRDARVDAVIVLSGARLGDGGLAFGRGDPALLAATGTDDPVNAPANTLAYYGLAHRPKFLLELVGASHLPPYSYAQPWLGIVERVSTAFLDTYLGPGGERPTHPYFGTLPRSALLTANP